MRRADVASTMATIVPLLRGPGLAFSLYAGGRWSCYSRGCIGPGCYSSSCRQAQNAAALTRDELAQLDQLPRKDLLLDHSVEYLLLTALDLLLAYAHEFRVMGGELGPESAATIARVSGSLSHLEVRGASLSPPPHPPTHRRLFIWLRKGCWTRPGGRGFHGRHGGVTRAAFFLLAGLFIASGSGRVLLPTELVVPTSSPLAPVHGGIARCGSPLLARSPSSFALLPGASGSSPCAWW